MSIRKRLAGWILGDKAALYMPKSQHHVLEDGCYESLTDEQLAMATRYWFDVIRRVNDDLAEDRGIPATVFSVSQSAMSLVRYAHEVRADELSIAQHGTVSGADVGNWSIQVTKLPADYQFGKPGVQEQVYAEDGRLTKLALGFSFGAPTP